MLDAAKSFLQLQSLIPAALLRACFSAPSFLCFPHTFHLFLNSFQASKPSIARCFLIVLELAGTIAVDGSRLPDCCSPLGDRLRTRTRTRVAAAAGHGWMRQWRCNGGEGISSSP